MFAVKTKYVSALTLALFLWFACNLGYVGMFEVREAVPAIAPIQRGLTGNPSASLMFNVDWGEEYLPGILDTLKEKMVKATFFLVGTWAERQPDLAKRIASEGHEIGNHGGAHVHVEMLSRENLHTVIKTGEERIFQTTGVKPSKLFAPPYGEWNDATVGYALELGYKTILWTVDTVDWREPPPETIWKRALAGAEPGCLVLLHPTENTATALPVIIDGFREKGLALVTVSENVIKKLDSQDPTGK